MAASPSSTQPPSAHPAHKRSPRRCPGTASKARPAASADREASATCPVAGTTSTSEPSSNPDTNRRCTHGHRPTRPGPRGGAAAAVAPHGDRHPKTPDARVALGLPRAGNASGQRSRDALPSGHRSGAARCQTPDTGSLAAGVDTANTPLTKGLQSAVRPWTHRTGGRKMSGSAHHGSGTGSVTSEAAPSGLRARQGSRRRESPACVPTRR